ncbi:MAG: hypothetical protein ACXWQO_15460, partial [Bdellovibrionota bacterium]
MMRANSVYFGLLLLLSAGDANAATCSESKDAGEQIVCPGPGCHGVTIGGKPLSAMEKIVSSTLSKAFSSNVQVFNSQAVGDDVQTLKESPGVKFGTEAAAAGEFPTIELNPDKKFQTMYGFGAALTEACAMHIGKLPKKLRNEFMARTFGPEGANFNLIRLPMGSTDFSDPVKGNYTYNDTKGNVPDPEFKHFSMARDEKTFELIREARKLNPNLKVMITPWSAPAWMKEEKTING